MPGGIGRCVERGNRSTIFLETATKRHRPSPTNTGTVPDQATLGKKTLRDGMERIWTSPDA